MQRAGVEQLAAHPPATAPFHADAPEHAFERRDPPRTAATAASSPSTVRSVDDAAAFRDEPAQRAAPGSHRRAARSRRGCELPHAARASG